METKEVKPNLVGKKCRCMFIDKWVTAIITAIEVDESYAYVYVKYDEPQQWGRESFATAGVVWGQLRNEVGTLKHLKII